jgi:hypothetical protein
VAAEAFAAAKAGRSFCSLSGMTKGHALLQSSSQEGFSASCEVMPCYNTRFNRVFGKL